MPTTLNHVTSPSQNATHNFNIFNSAIFVQPLSAKLLHSVQLKQAMGEPPKSDEPVLLADGQDLNPKHKHR
ncbi:uncharacterized protein LACBIDRAFT_310730 [Laccaria bicolor S238N-H82]|uniref:Predicted protein n=1 Tax=Laccaria bicolor (strain S238N-H82 / ATCC MYA-4686) TaxID=486041 RepID=B0DIS2_LACBS|nr:uncharacterized protein LACBIDRAFT_303019 [Laccaria bicolor S238N-H82]XP_001887777.1 uncharacterized protein LACBIDRAFT_310730 [Laccaria bicolor S238N-H82]EDR01701.1 predicted protein [Laccaria bicolor S238N-H82]EDR05282.1 predicted protein [Laccaria bicolor S238N-H82]|eukprot:XP_001883840.1 predicted protein [Laccaria bicolor S238N-H82]